MSEIASSKTAWQSFKEKIFTEQGKTPRRKFYNTLWALLFGFLIIGLVFLISGYNPFNVFSSIIKNGLKTNGNTMITYFVAYCFAALGVAFCFKAGMFNIGISGQMMSAGFVTLLIFRTELLTKDSISGGSIALAFILSILIGMFVATIAGLLKAYLGINEVVSTIMINWIVFFVIKSIVFEFQSIDGKDFLADNNSISNLQSIGYIMPDFFYPTNLTWYSNKWNWIIISLAIIFVIVVWFIISKTSFGYKIKMVGLNKDAAEYSGTNKKTLILISFAISGMFAGIAGFIWYIGTGGSIEIKSQPLNAGFDAIAISLLVFNNPIGVFFSSFLYGSLKAGTAYVSSDFPGMPSEINEVIIGIMVYSAALTFVFTKLNLIEWTKRFFIFQKYKIYKSERVIYWKINLQHPLKWFKIQIEIFKIWNKNYRNWNKIKKEHKKQINNLEKELINAHSLKVFDVSKLSPSEQVKYFDTLAILKRKYDEILANEQYFEKNNIKGSLHDERKQAKTKIFLVKKMCLKKYAEEQEQIIDLKNQYKQELKTTKDNQKKQEVKSLYKKELNSLRKEIKEGRV